MDVDDAKTETAAPGADVLTGDGSGTALPPIEDSVAGELREAPARSLHDRDIEADPPTEHRDMADGHGHAVSQASADAIAAASERLGFPAPELRIRADEKEA